MTRNLKLSLAGIGAALALTLLTAGACDESPPAGNGADKAKTVADSRQNYVPKNDVEGKKIGRASCRGRV